MTARPDLTQGRARKSLGQHFLYDPDILHRAATAAGSPEGRIVVEVGPGPGGLTRAILDAGAAHLIAVEADARFAEGLRSWPEFTEGRLQVIEGDARKVDIATAVLEAPGAGPAMVIGNLPYNVGTPLLIDWLRAGDWRGEMALMFQKEVAERICAAPGTAHYGRLAVISQAVCEASIAFTLPPGAFKPPPKVDSAVARLMPLPAAERFNGLQMLEKVSAAAFGQRRKMLRAALRPLAKSTGWSADAWLEAAGIDPTARAETIDQQGFRRLATALAGHSGNQAADQE